MIDDVLYTHCRRCNGRLKKPVSQLRGFGPVCAKKVKYAEGIDLVNYGENPKLVEEQEQNFMDELLERRKVV